MLARVQRLLTLPGATVVYRESSPQHFPCAAAAAAASTVDGQPSCGGEHTIGAERRYETCAPQVSWPSRAAALERAALLPFAANGSIAYLPLTAVAEQGARHVGRRAGSNITDCTHWAMPLAGVGSAVLDSWSVMLLAALVGRGMLER